jgi:hypothetical protein
MRNLFISGALLFIALNTQAATQSSGSIVKLVGKAWKLSKSLPKPISLKNGSSVSSGDIVQTDKKSFVRIRMTDETILSVGSKSKLEIKHYEYQTNSIRKTIYKLQYGKLRSFIKKKAKEGDEIRVNTNAVAIGIRGTEILSNAYVVQNKATTDTMLLSGKANASVNGTSKAIKSFEIKAGQVFNSNKFNSTEGLKALDKVAPETLEALKKNPNAFLPNLQLSTGKFLDFKNALRKGLGLPSLPVSAVGAGAGAIAGALTGTAAGLAAGNSGDDKKEDKAVVAKSASKKVEQKKKGQHPNIIEQAGPVDLAKLPDDIREAYQKRKQMRKENECYYWFYKKIPGYGNVERFRRERDCDEYDYDL